MQMSRSISDNLGINWQALGSLGNIGTIGVAMSRRRGHRRRGHRRRAARQPVSERRAGAAPDLEYQRRAHALASDNLVRILAEPNLTVISGQKASFLVGGEIPVPVPGQNGQVTVEYKNFGVSLSFRPHRVQ